MTRRLLRLALAAALLAAPAPPAARAQVAPGDSTDLRRREEQLRLEAAKRRELEEVNQQARASREQATRLRGRETQALGQLRGTQRELNLTRRRLRQLQTRRHALDQQLGATRQTLQQTRASLERQKARLARRLRATYKSGADRELEFLLSTRSFAQLLARWDFLVMLAEQDRVLLEDIAGKQQQVEATEDRLEENLGEIRQNEQQTAKQDRRLGQLATQRERQVAQIRSQRKTYEAAAAELEKTAKDIQRLLARLERQRQEEAQRLHDMAPRAQLRFDDTAAPPFTDASGNGHDGTCAPLTVPCVDVTLRRITCTSQKDGWPEDADGEFYVELGGERIAYRDGVVAGQRPRVGGGRAHPRRAAAHLEHDHGLARAHPRRDLEEAARLLVPLLRKGPCEAPKQPCTQPVHQDPAASTFPPERPHEPCAFHGSEEVDSLSLQVAVVIEGPGIPEVPRTPQADGHLQAVSEPHRKSGALPAQRYPDRPGTAAPSSAPPGLLHAEQQLSAAADGDRIVGDPAPERDGEAIGRPCSDLGSGQQGRGDEGLVTSSLQSGAGAGPQEHQESGAKKGGESAETLREEAGENPSRRSRKRHEGRGHPVEGEDPRAPDARGESGGGSEGSRGRGRGMGAQERRLRAGSALRAGDEPTMPRGGRATSGVRRRLARIIHEAPTATADLAALTGVLGSRTLRRTASTPRVLAPAGARDGNHLHGLATDLHE